MRFNPPMSTMGKSPSDLSVEIQLIESFLYHDVSHEVFIPAKPAVIQLGDHHQQAQKVA